MHLTDGEVDTQICPHCGQPEVAEIMEIWAPREFMMETCCEGMHAAVNEFLAEDGKRAAEWLRSKGMDELVGTRSRRVVEVDGQLVIDWQLDITDISLGLAKDFVREHHRHCPPPVGWRFGAGIKNGSELIGVVMVGRPVARMLDASKIVEVNRLCVRNDVAPALVWNACSMLYAWAAREARKRGFQKIITYTLEDEAGTSLRAAGWQIEHTTRGGSWNTPSRARVDKTVTSVKNRWSPAIGQRASGNAPASIA
jgi:hypothetical protein